MLSEFDGLSLPDAIDRLEILPADWDCWPPRPTPRPLRVIRSSWMSGEPQQPVAVAGQSIITERARIDRALKESSLFKGLWAGELTIEAKRRDDHNGYLKAETLDREVWQFERPVIQRSPPILFRKLGGQWVQFVNPMVRLSPGPRPLAEPHKKKPAYEIMRDKKFELVKEDTIHRGMIESRQHDLVLKALDKKGDEPGYSLDNFAKNVADKWPSD